MVASTFTQALFDKICDELADGKSLREVCKMEGMPNRRTFQDWWKRTPELKAQYDAACIEREEVYFEQIIDIADEDPLLAFDFEKRGKDDIQVARVDSAAVAHQRNRIAARQWALARMNRKKYGDHVTEELTGPNGGPLQIERVRLNMAPVEELPE